MYLIRYFKISVKETDRVGQRTVKITYGIEQGLNVPVTHDTGR